MGPRRWEVVKECVKPWTETGAAKNLLGNIKNEDKKSGRITAIDDV